FSHEGRRDACRRLALALAALILAPAAGCGGGLDALVSTPPSDGLRIATPWPREERARLAGEFAGWLRGRPDEPVEAGAIVWIETADDEPIDRAARRPASAPDVLLGGDAAAYARMTADGRLESLSDGAPKPYWIVARSAAIGLEPGPGRLALADPRLDPPTLAWCLARVDDEGWRAGYAELLDHYGESAAVGWRATSARAAIGRGRAARTLTTADASEARHEEGAAIVKGTSRPRAARAFLKFVEEAGGGGPGPRFEAIGQAGALAWEGDLAADLLGATLVDAQEELAVAVAAVKAAGSPQWAVERLTQPPPWPPASIEKLLARPGEDGPALVDSLTGQFAPDPAARDWLARSWLAPRRDLDRSVVAEIAAAAGGRLAGEPRFRSWLRAEWTQWARQRYRWVARLAAAKPPPSES
uniref:hypothetical protein n=1 Tax=Paludisphaera sp. TaxID=2017432 RepID=UPI00301D3379